MPGWNTSKSSTRAAAQILLNAQFVRRLGPGSPVHEFQEIAAATFEAGQFVAVDAATGQIQEAATGAAAVLGVATKGATGLAGSTIPVIVGAEDVIFLMACDATPALEDIMEYHDLIISGGGVHQVDVGVAADALFQIVGLPAGYNDSTSPNFQKAYVRVITSQWGHRDAAA